MSIRFDKRNYRKHSSRNKELIRKSLSDLGAGRSVLIDADDSLIAGNGVYEQAQKLGIPVRVVETDGTELIAVKRTDVHEEDEKRKMLAFADNATSDSSEFDMELITADFHPMELAEWDVTIPDLQGGVSDDSADHSQEEAKEDDFDETKDNIERVCKLGDLWQLGEHRLLCGDSTKVESYQMLMQGEKAQMVFTDPPYGYEYKSNKKRNGGENYDVIMNDDKILDFFPFVKEYCDGFVFVCTAYKVLDIWMPLFKKYLPLTNMLIWAKGGTGMGDLKRTFATDYEVILVSHQGKEFIGNRCGSVWKFNTDVASSYVHPTQKPVALSAEAITRTSQDNNIILDCFGGSGSTLIACEQLGRKARLMELDPHYCDVIIARWEKFSGQKAVKL